MVQVNMTGHAQIFSALIIQYKKENEFSEIITFNLGGFHPLLA